MKCRKEDAGSTSRTFLGRECGYLWGPLRKYDSAGGRIWTKNTTVKLRAVLADGFTQQLRHQSADRGSAAFGRQLRPLLISLAWTRAWRGERREAARGWTRQRTC